MLSIHWNKFTVINSFVAACIDKAKDNVVLICKRFYLEVLLEELGIYKKEWTDQMYKRHSFIDQEFINKHSQYIKTLILHLMKSTKLYQIYSG